MLFISERVPTHWFISQMPVVAETWSGWTWKLGTQSASPTWVAGTQLSVPSPLPSRMSRSRKRESRSRSQELNPGNPLWDLAILTDVLTTLIINYWQNYTKECITGRDCIHVYSFVEIQFKNLKSYMPVLVKPSSHWDSECT